MSGTLRLAVFDLDYTIWDPEMYQLHGAPRLRPIDSKDLRVGVDTCGGVDRPDAAAAFDVV